MNLNLLMIYLDIRQVMNFRRNQHKRISRKKDIVARVSKDEFVITMHNTEANEAKKVIIKIKKELKNEFLQSNVVYQWDIVQRQVLIKT